MRLDDLRVTGERIEGRSDAADRTLGRFSPVEGVQSPRADGQVQSALREDGVAEGRDDVPLLRPSYVVAVEQPGVGA
jgi:hypothetical protein